MSLFSYAIQVWGVACYSRYLFNIDRIQKRTVKSGYIKYIVPLEELLEKSDKALWKKVMHNPVSPLHDLLSPKETEC